MTGAVPFPSWMLPEPPTVCHLAEYSESLLRPGLDDVDLLAGADPLDVLGPAELFFEKRGDLPQAPAQPRRGLRVGGQGDPRIVEPLLGSPIARRPQGHAEVRTGRKAGRAGLAVAH